MDNRVYIAFILIIILLMVIFYLLMRSAQQKQQASFRKLMEQSLKQQDEELDRFQSNMNSQLLTYQASMNEYLHNELMRSNQYNNQVIDQFSAQTEQRLNRMHESIFNGMQNNYEKTNESFRNINAQVAVLRKTQENISGLEDEIIGLQNIFLDRKSRGIFGEVELENLMKQVYGIDERRWKRQYKLSNGTIADCVLFEPEPLGNVIIDAKFPLENYNRMVQTENTKAQQDAAMAQFKKDVKKHISDISNKYRIPGETADIAFMFVPAEAVFAEIYGHFDDLIQYAYQQHVYIVSPTTLMAYLTALRSFYLERVRNEKHQQLQQEYLRLENEFDRFEKRFKAFVNDYEKTYQDMRDISITADKIHRRFIAIQQIDPITNENNSASEDDSL